MARRRIKGKAKEVNKKLLEWRSKQKPGAIMKPGTFKSIEVSAAKNKKITNPAAVAGAAYWKAVRAKFKAAKTKGKSK